jgi:hypothetical protein
MKKVLLLIGIFAALMGSAQTKEYAGKWELCKIVTVKGDTQHIAKTDSRWISYNFEYNNTFTSWTKDKDGEASGRWGFDFQDKYIKIKNPVYTFTKKKIGDYNIVIQQVTPVNFVEKREEEKRKFSYWIYCRVK